MPLRMFVWCQSESKIELRSSTTGLGQCNYIASTTEPQIGAPGRGGLRGQNHGDSYHFTAEQGL